MSEDYDYARTIPLSGPLDAVLEMWFQGEEFRIGHFATDGEYVWWLAYKLPLASRPSFTPPGLELYVVQDYLDNMSTYHTNLITKVCDFLEKHNRFEEPYHVWLSELKWANNDMYAVSKYLENEFWNAVENPGSVRVIS